MTPFTKVPKNTFSPHTHLYAIGANNTLTSYHFFHRLGAATLDGTTSQTTTSECARATSATTLLVYNPYTQTQINFHLCIYNTPLSYSTELYTIHTFAQVCDQPGVRCGNELVKTKDLLTHELRVAQYILAGSFAIYIMSIGPKISYYTTALDQTLKNIPSTYKFKPQ